MVEVKGTGNSGKREKGGGGDERKRGKQNQPSKIVDG